MCDMYMRLYARGNCQPMTTIISYFMMVESLKNMHDPLFSKYYKGAAEPLYFPYVPHNDQKVCPKVKISYCYGGLKCGNIIFDEFLLYDWLKEHDSSLSGKLNKEN